jgi:hypothetical protein
MIHDEDKSIVLHDIEHRVNYEESKIVLAKTYKEDVRFLIDLINEQQKKLDEFNKLVFDRVAMSRHIQFIQDLHELLSKYDLNLRGPTA